MAPRNDMDWADHLESEDRTEKKGRRFWVIWVVFYLVLMFAMLVYSVYPVLVHSFVRVARSDRYREIEFIALPGALQVHFETEDSRFEEIGFKPVVTVTEDESLPGIKYFLRAYENHEDEVMAIAVAVVPGPSGSSSGYNAYVEFSTYYEDGREISSSSWDDVYPFRTTPERQFASLPELDDPRELYRVHEWRIDQAAEGARKFFEPGDGPEHLRWAIDEEMKAEERSGHLKLDPKSGFYTLTWKGAYVAAFKQMWPFEGRIKNARDREARQLLEELDGPPEN